MTVGILGLGLHLPAEVRRNDWWTPDDTERWSAQRKTSLPPLRDLSDAALRVVSTMAAQEVDPFLGVVARHVMPDGITATDMEVLAAEQALAHAGIEVRDIDILISHTAVPDYLLSNPSAALHRRLALRPDALAIQLDASAYSFIAQLALAEQLIGAGRIRHALLVQSTAASRLLDRNDWESPAFGDAATAVVVGPVPAGGILSAVHRTDGRFPRTLIAAVRGGRWYDDGRSVLHSADPFGARQVFVETLDCGSDVVGSALRDAGAQPDQVDFFAVHQGTSWLRSLSQSVLGLTRARYVDLFPHTGYLFAASIPAVLRTAHDTKLVRENDLVVLFGGGTGATYGSIVLRWGPLQP